MPGYRCHRLLVFFLTACATSLDQSNWAASMQREPLDQGISRTFPTSLEVTLRAAEDALPVAGLVQALDCAAADYQHGEVTPRCTERAVTRIGDHIVVIRGLRRSVRGAVSRCVS